MLAGGDWQPDILGPGFEQLTLPLAPDAEGDVVGTLVRYRPAKADGLADGGRETDVLYVHGWSDYFFQTELARYWHDAGTNFYALDLRKYGRSIRPHQTRGLVASLDDYDEEIEAALAAIGHGQGTESGRRLVLMGHSTGGLTMSLWAHNHPGRAAALLLNSPWLEFQWNSAARIAISPVVNLQARSRANSKIRLNVPDFYSRAVDLANEGHLEYNKEWRPDRGFPIYAGWMRAVFAAHAQVAEGLSIDCPVLVLLSTRSALQRRWKPEMATADLALDVDVVAHRVLSLGETVTLARIPGALHDVVLSPPAVRARAFAEITRWLEGYLPRDVAPPEPAPRRGLWARLTGRG